jgi:urease subunit alpha
VSQACLDDAQARAALPAGHRYTAIADSRGLTCDAMRFNTATPTVEVQPEPVPVRVDGVEIAMHHARTLPLTQLHHLG